MFSIRESPEPADTGPQQFDGDGGGAERALGDRGDGDAAAPEPVDQGAGVVVELVEVDLEPRRGHRTPAISDSSSRGEGGQHHVDQLLGRPGQGVGGGDAELGLVEGDGGGDLGVGHVLVVDRQADDLGGGEGLDEVDLAGRGRHRQVTEVAEPGAARGVLEDDGVGPAAAEDERRGQVGGVAERALALDDDHVGVLALEGLDHGGLHLARAELGGDGVEGDAVAGALDQAGLAGADHHRLDALGR